MALFINGVGQDTFSMNGVSIDNLYVDGVLVWTSFVPEAIEPRYELTEALVDTSTVDDSANTLPDYNGELTESVDVFPYEPTELQYPRNGLLELDEGRILHTSFDQSTNHTAMYGIYDADGSTTYKIWAIDYDDFNIYSIYEGDQDTPIVKVTSAFLDIPSPIKITDGRPSWLPPLDTELWDGEWNPDSGLYFDDITVPAAGEVCGPDNFASTTSFHYMTSSIDVSAHDSVEIIRDATSNRNYLMYKATSDGLCKWWGELTPESTDILDTSNMDYIIIYTRLGEIDPAPSLSVKGL